MFADRWEELGSLIKKCESTIYNKPINHEKSILNFHAQLLKAKNQQGIVYVIGNGGSAGIASHFSVDFLNALQIPSNTLYDSNIMTCISNDYGYEHVFSKPLDTLLRKEDLLVAISSSGKSANIVNAAHIAAKKNVPIITLSGFSKDNPLRKLGGLNYWIDSSDYGLVESGHFFLLHTIVDSWENTFSSLENPNVCHQEQLV